MVERCDRLRRLVSLFALRFANNSVVVGSERIRNKNRGFNISARGFANYLLLRDLRAYRYIDTALYYEELEQPDLVKRIGEY